MTDRLSKWLDVGSGIIISVVGLLLVWRLLEPSFPSKPVASIEHVFGPRIDPRNIRKSSGRGLVAVVEFSDYQCPFCRQYARDVLPAVRRAYLESGKIRYVSFEFPMEGIHNNAMKASLASECAARQGVYWKMHDRLFLRSMDGDSTPDDMADGVDLDQGAFRTCVTGDAMTMVRADLAEGKRLGVTGTPSFFVGSVAADGSITLRTKIVGSPTLDALGQEIKRVSASFPPSADRPQ
jgi:protein-disulfide isomerase